MSINPVSDIVLDVARAADPMKSQAATEKLLSAAGAGQSSNGGFDTALSDVDATQANASKPLESIGANSAVVLAQIDARTKAYKGLEQLVLKNLLESMLPKESGALFGVGTAGDIWRSMLADQLAKQIGKTVNLGIGSHSTVTPNSQAHQVQADAKPQALKPGENSLNRQL